MMVVMTQTMAGPDCPPRCKGAKYDVPKSEAIQLCRDGIAQPVGWTLPGIETATAPAAPEKAQSPRGKKG